MTQEEDDFMGGGFKSFIFESEGDMIVGKIITKPEKLQQTDVDSGELKTWDDGKPMWYYRLTLQTDLRDPNDQFDDGVRSLSLSWHRLTAVRNAVKKAGAKNIEIGGDLWLRFDAYGPKTKSAFSAPKVGWSAGYRAPVATEGFMDTPTTGQQATPAAPIRTAAPSTLPRPVHEADTANSVLDSLKRTADAQKSAAERLKDAFPATSTAGHHSTEEIPF